MSSRKLSLINLYLLPLGCWNGLDQKMMDADIHRVSKKTAPTYFLLYVCQIWTDFNKNCKDCPWRNP